MIEIKKKIQLASGGEVTLEIVSDDLDIVLDRYGNPDVQLVADLLHRFRDFENRAAAEPAIVPVSIPPPEPPPSYPPGTTEEDAPF